MLLPDFTVGDNNEIFGIISLVSFLIAMIFAIVAIGSFIGAVSTGAAVGFAVTFLFLAGLFQLITLMVSGVRFSQNAKLKGKGFFFTSLGIWLLNLFSFIIRK
jgi:hypothetical protein